MGHPNICRASKHMGVSTHIQGPSKKGVPHMCGCPLYIHNTKKACFVRLRGCPSALIHFDAPISLHTSICLDGPLYVWMPPMPPCMFGHPQMFGCPCKLGCPLCLDAPYMLGHSHMFRCPPYVYMMFGCPLYKHNTKKACFVRLRGCPYAPIHVDAPCTSTTERKHTLSG